MVRGFVGGVSQTLIKVVWLAWVYIVLRWVKNNGRGSNFGTLFKIMPNHLHQPKQLNFNPHFCLTKHINQ